MKHALALPLLTASFLACGRNPATLVGSYSADFGQVSVNSQSHTTITLENPTETPVRFTAIDAATDPEFGTSLPVGAGIPADNTLAVDVSFAPSSTGQKSGQIVLHTDNPAAATITLALTGEGVPFTCGVTATPQMLEFGNLVVGTSVVRSVTLFNCGALDLVVTPESVQGASAQAFIVNENGPFTVLAGGSIDLSVTYAPLVASANDSAILTLVPSAGNAIEIALQGTALQGGLQITPSTMDFRFVQPGGSAMQPLTLTNVGNTEITVSALSVVDPGTPAAFLLPGAPLGAFFLEPGDVQTFNVSFAPTTRDLYSGQISISSSDSPEVVPVPLSGFGGGAILSCAPTAVVFGTVTANIGLTLPLTCTNEGSDVPGHPEAGLSVTQLSTDEPVFSAFVDSASPAQPLAAGQTLTIDVTYLPTSASSDSATLQIFSEAANAVDPLAVALSGNALHEGPCAFSMVPSAMNFGQIEPGQSATQTFVITNLGPDECLVNGIGLAAGSDPAFSLVGGPILSQQLSAPNTTPPGAFPSSLAVSVTFAPQVAGSYSGSVQLTISDPSAPYQTVSLSGTAGSSCFVLRPSALDFGTVGLVDGQLCGGRGPKLVVGVNNCTQDLTIVSTTTVPGLSIVSQQVPQTVLAGGTSTPFELGFEFDIGAAAGELLFQTDLQLTPFGLPWAANVIDGGQLTDTFTGISSKMDVLFVVDTSMATEQWAPLSDFVSYVSGIDYQIAVTTTDVCGGTTSEDGRLLPCPDCKIDGGVPSIITPADLNAGADLATLVDVGRQHSDNCTASLSYPQFFEAADEALGGSVAYNQGFVRPDAWHAVVALSSAFQDDDSPNSVTAYANAFLAVGDPNVPASFSFNYASPNGLSDGGQEQGDSVVSLASLPPRLSSLMTQLGGIALDATAPFWVGDLESLWPTQYRFPLSGFPDATTVQVAIDGVPLASGWTYDPTTNAVLMGIAAFALVSTDTVTVTYTLLCN